MDMRVTRTTRAVNGVSGVALQTRAVQGSSLEVRLQEIQLELAGKQLAGTGEPIAHLFLVAQQAPDPATGRPGSAPTIIGLWVPSAQERQAEVLLTKAGFHMTGSQR
jgi:hypothetical protein